MKQARVFKQQKTITKKIVKQVIRNASVYTENETPIGKDGVPYTLVFTDGACTSNGKKGAKAGVGVYFGKNDPRNISKPFTHDNPTNQRAEIDAVICAFKAIDSSNHVWIKSDSKYVINACTDWRYSWEANGWKNASKKPVSNKDLWTILFKLIDERKGEVKFTHVAGHSGDPGNDAADRLAVAGINKL